MVFIVAAIYYDKLNKLAELKMVELPIVPVDCNHNAHMFFIKVVQASDRNKLIDYLKTKNMLSIHLNLYHLIKRLIII